MLYKSNFQIQEFDLDPVTDAARIPQDVSAVGGYESQKLTVETIAKKTRVYLYLCN